MHNPVTFRSRNLLFTIVLLVTACWPTHAVEADEEKSREKPKAEGVVVKLHASDRLLRAYDPLLVRVTITNKSDKDVLANPSLESSSGQIQFGRRLVDGPWKRARTLGGGLRCVIGEPIVISPGESYASYEVLFHDGSERGEYILTLPGRYELVAEVHLRDKTVATSAPLPLLVTETPQAEIDAIKATEYISAVASARTLLKSWPMALTKLEQELSSGQLKEVLRWGRQLHEIKSNPDVEVRASEMETLNKMRNSLDNVTNEVISLKLARHHINEKEFGKAKAAIEELPVLCRQSERLLALLKDEQRKHEQ